MNVLIQPHSDDAVLFACFTLLRVPTQTLVITVFDGYEQRRRGLPVDMELRRKEDRLAFYVLGIEECRTKYLGFRDDCTATRDDIRNAIRQTMSEYNPLAQYDNIYAPAFEQDGHAQHNLVAEACNDIVTERYLTYTSAGKSTSDREVKIERPWWIAAKLRAMACYVSQMSLDPRMGCWPHFVRGIQEYYL